jgi:hypothetical protein
VLVVNQGTNDGVGGADSFVPLYTAYLRAIRVAHPATLVIALEPFGIDGLTSPRSRDISVAVSAVGDSRVVFVSTRGWLLPPDFTDRVHVNPAGYRKVAQHLIPVITQQTDLEPVDCECPQVASAEAVATP